MKTFKTLLAEQRIQAALVHVDPNNTQTVVRVIKTFTDSKKAHSALHSGPSKGSRDPLRLISKDSYTSGPDDYTWKVKSPF